MSNLEERNYWNDHRVRAGMINRGKIVEENNTRYLVIETENEEGEEVEIKLLCKWSVCSTCDGNGKHVNPSIDCGGLTAEDFDEDPDFRDNYMSGMYDQTCNECKGLRVVPEVDRDHNNPEQVQQYDDYLQEQYDSAAESAAERAMGA